MNPANRQRRGRPRPRVEALEVRTLMSVAGSLDPSFGGGNGYVELPLGIVPNGTGLNAVTVQSVSLEPAGQILVNGSTSEQVSQGGQLETVVVPSLTMFNANGTLDTSFGNQGHVVIPANFSVIIQPLDGKLVLYGPANDGGGNATYEAIRLNTNGSLDTTYGTGGVAEYPADTATPVAERLGDPVAAVNAPNGQIVLLGSSLASSVRLNADGSLDTNYGQAGTANPTVSLTGTISNSVIGAAIQSDGRIVVVSNVVTGIVEGRAGPTYQYEVAAARLNTDGSLDTNYNPSGSTPGVVVLPADPLTPANLGVNKATSVAVDPVTGDAVISSSDNYVNTLYSIKSTGLLDPAFGSNGKLTTAVAGQVAIQPADGKIVVTGAYLVERLDTDGTPDATFGSYLTPGVATISANITGYTTYLAIQPSGSIVVASQGGVPYAGTTDLGFALTQILPQATANPPAARPKPANPASLGGYTQTLAALYQVASGTFGYGYNSGIVAAGDPLTTVQFGVPGTGQTIPATADYLGAGHQQIAAYLTASGTYAIQTGIGAGYSLQFGTKGAGQTIPAPADYEGTGQADIAVYLTASGSFAILPSNGSPGRIVQLGTSGVGQSIPAPADYYHTRQDDLAVYLEASGAFAIQDPTGKTSGAVIPFGMPGLGQSIPVPGDYDGSGHTELAVYIPSLGAFYYRPFGGGKDVEVKIGTANSGELPVVGDYDNAGYDEFAIYDATRGFLAYQPASGGADVVISVLTPTGGSIPVATPAGALPEFNGPSGSGSGIKANAIGSPLASANSTPSPSTTSLSVSSALALPKGPAPGSFRVGLAPVNQGSTDSLKYAS